MWLAICGNENLKNQSAKKLTKNASICAKHFKMWCFLSGKKKRLVENAVPALDKDSAMAQLKIHQSQSRNKSNIVEPNPALLSVSESADLIVPSSSAFHQLDDSQLLMCDQNIQTTSINDLACAPRKKKLSKQLSNKIRTMRRMKEKYSKLKQWSKKWNTPETSITLKSQLINEGVDEKVANFIARQVRLSLSRGKNKKFHEEDKLLAYNIMCRSKAAYNILKEVLVLPSENTLRNFMRSKFEKPGLNKSVLSIIAKKIQNKSDMYKNYILIFDEMSIKPYLIYDSRNDVVVGFEDFGGIKGRSKCVANQLLVLMIRSLCSNKKMPIGFYFTRNAIPSASLKDIIEEAISHLQECGINVCALVCDQGANNIRLFSLLGATSANPYFTKNDKKIYTIYDPPHLLKSLRRNLMKHNLVVTSGIVSFDHVIQFYNYDKTKQRRLAPKLTDNHVYAEGLQSMKVSLASQIFSNTVAASMHVCIAADIISNEAIHTVEFIGKINDLFDSLNGTTVMPLRGKPFHCVFNETSPHFKFWNDTIAEIEKWYFIDKARNSETQRVENKKKYTKCLNGWIHTLRALSSLCNELKNDLKFIIPRRFNQDCLENFFSRLRGCGGYRTNPTSYDIQSAFKMVCVNSWKQNIKTKNCEDDDDQFFLDLIKANIEPKPNNVSRLNNGNTSTSSNIIILKEHVVNNETIEDLSNFDGLFDRDELQDTVEINVNFFLAGYIAKRCLHNLSCDMCISSLSKNNKTLDSRSLYTYFRTYLPHETAYGLTYPSDNMCEAFSSFVNISDSYFYDKLYEPNVLQTLINLFKNAEKLTFIECSLHVTPVSNIILTTSAKLCMKMHLRELNRKIAINVTNLKNLRKDVKLQSSSKIL